MEVSKDNFRLAAAVAIGAIGGLLLGNYVWGKDGTHNPLSKHLATLSEILEQIDAKIDAAVEHNDVDNISLHNQAFHRHLYCANPFQVAVPLIESLWLQLGPFSRIAISKLEKVYLVDRHVEALEALRQRNSVGLRCAIEADIRDGIASIKTVDGIHDYFEGVA